MTPRDADLVIVGAGIVGSCIAAATARAGFDTCVVEQQRIGASGATGASGGIVRTYHDDPALADRAALAMNALGSSPEFTRTGFLSLHPPEAVERAVAEVQRLRSRYATELELLTPERLSGRFPMLNTSGLGVGVFEPNAGFVDPTALSRRFAREAREHGARLLEGVSVSAMRVDTSGALELECSLGTLRPRTLIVAAGAASSALLAWLDEPLALRSKGICARHLIAETEHALPCGFEDLTTGMYGRPLGGRRFLIGRPTTDWDLPPNASPPLRADPLFEYALRMRLPRCAAAVSEGGRYAVDGYTPDGLGIVRSSARVGNLFIATGFSGSGVKLAPAAAERVLNWVRAR